MGLLGFRFLPKKKNSAPEVINNHFIGGVASYINTPATIRPKLGYIPETSITNVIIDGDDISFHVDTTYTIGANAWINDYSITHFIDYEGKCVGISDRSFRSGTIGAGVLQYVYLPGCITAPNTYHYYRRNELLEIVMPAMTTVGTDPAVFDNFIGGLPNLSATKAWFNSALQTNNGGGIDDDIQYVIGRGATVTWVDNTTAPEAINDLTITAVGYDWVELSWTPPTAFNGIKEYEVFVDSMRAYKTTSTSVRVAGLTNGQVHKFRVKTIDNYYIYGDFSNPAYQLVNGAQPIWSNEFVANYNFTDNVLDTSGNGYDGIANNITYQDGIGGRAIVLNDTSSSVDLQTNTLTGNKNAFSIVAYFKMQTSNDVNVIYASWLTTSQVILRVHTGFLQFYTHTGNDGGGQVGGSFGAGFTDTTTYHQVVATYDGKEMKVYLDKVLQGTKKQHGKLNLGGENEFWGQRGGINFGNHLIDSGAIFNYALSQADINAIYDLQNTGNDLI